MGMQFGIFTVGDVTTDPTTLAYLGAVTDRIVLSTSTTLVTTTDPVLIAENYAKLQAGEQFRGADDLLVGRWRDGVSL